MLRDLDTLEGDERFKQLLWDIATLHAKKQADYGSKDDPFANVRASVEYGVPPYLGVLIRMNDKIQRLKQFVRKGVLANESFEDSLMDLAVYALIDIILYREESK